MPWLLFCGCGCPDADEGQWIRQPAISWASSTARWIDCHGGLDIHHHAFLQAARRAGADANHYPPGRRRLPRSTSATTQKCRYQTDDHRRSARLPLVSRLLNSPLSRLSRLHAHARPGTVGITQVNALDIRALFLQFGLVDRGEPAQFSTTLSRGMSITGQAVRSAVAVVEPAAALAIPGGRW